MRVHFMSKPGMFLDLLVQAVAESGHDIGKVLNDLDACGKFPQDALVLMICRSLQDDFCMRLRRLRLERPDLCIAIVCPQRLETELIGEIGAFVNGIFSDEKPVSLIFASLAVMSQGYRLVEQAQIDTAALAQASIGVAKELPTPVVSELSAREQDVLEEMRRGRSNKEIARALDISASTVKVHTRSIFRKLGVNNRTQAALFARGKE